jgi:hypothetical protein
MIGARNKSTPTVPRDLDLTTGPCELLALIVTPGGRTISIYDGPDLVAEFPPLVFTANIPFRCVIADKLLIRFDSQTTDNSTVTVNYRSSNELDSHVP